MRIIKKKNNFFSCFDITENLKKKRLVKNVLIPLLGSHNIINTLGAYSVARGLKVPESKILNSLKNFEGVKRRFSIIYNNSKNLIIDDYAHHPEEIKVTLNSLRYVTKKKLITIFEPHRYSRIKGMKKDFLSCFNLADVILILPIYTAGEKKDNKISNELMEKSLSNKYKNKLVKSVKGNTTFFKYLQKIISEGDNVIFLGAGNSSKIANSFSLFLKDHEL